VRTAWIVLRLGWSSPKVNYVQSRRHNLAGKCAGLPGVSRSTCTATGFASRYLLRQRLLTRNRKEEGTVSSFAGVLIRGQCARDLQTHAAQMLGGQKQSLAQHIPVESNNCCRTLPSGCSASGFYIKAGG